MYTTLKFAAFANDCSITVVSTTHLVAEDFLDIEDVTSRGSERVMISSVGENGEIALTDPLQHPHSAGAGDVHVPTTSVELSAIVSATRTTRSNASLLISRRSRRSVHRLGAARL